MNNVYDQIISNDRRTAAILLAFPIALFVTVFLLLLLLAQTGILPFDEFGIYESGAAKQGFKLTLTIFPWMSMIVFLWIAFSYFRGGSMMLRMANAYRVTFEEDRELYRLVENTAIMAGLPTPEIYLFAGESMNAFATGKDPKTACIALSEGIVKNLDKDELQAVIAHELAHIGNRDTRLMLITVAGIGCFIFFGELLLRAAFRRGRNSSNKKGALIFLAIGIAFLIFGYIIAPILRFALSRRREYQADATAAKITRDPGALARALEKIAVNSKIEGTSPLASNIYIANPAKIGFIGKLYTTHPPIGDRIAALYSMTIKGRALT
jgi:heat shock protein HtpX